MNYHEHTTETLTADYVLYGFGAWLLVMLLGVLTMAVFSFLDYRETLQRNSTTDDP